MKALLPFIPLAIMMIVIPAVYGLVIKLSASSLHINEITWKNGFVFGVIIIFLALVFRIIVYKLEYPIPFIIRIVLGPVLCLFIGGWFFRERGRYTEGNLLGWGGALKLTGLSYAIFIVLGGLFVLVSKTLFTKTMPYRDRE